MAVFYLLIEPLGLVFSSMLAYGAYMLVIRAALVSRRRALTAVLLAVGLPILLHLFFAHVAGVPIPQARFFRFP